jgi:hypothetical protein
MCAVYDISGSIEGNLLEKLIVVQLVKKLSAFYGT